MAFRWEIYDVVEQTDSEQSSGELKLNDLQIGDTPAWLVETANPARRLPAEDGGSVGNIGLYAQIVHGEDREFARIVIIALISAFLLGYTLVVVSDVVHDKLSFREYMAIVGSFVTGVVLGRGLPSRDKRTNKSKAKNDGGPT